MHLVIRIVEPIRILCTSVTTAKPVFQRNSDFPQIILREHDIVPYEQFSTIMVGEGEVDREIERGIFGCIGGADGTFGDGCLEPNAWKRDDDESVMDRE